MCGGALGSSALVAMGNRMMAADISTAPQREIMAAPPRSDEASAIPKAAAREILDFPLLPEAGEGGVVPG
jgi:hypothetical protein